MSITTRTLLAGAAAAAIAVLVTVLAMTSDSARSSVHDHARIQLRAVGVPLPRPPPSGPGAIAIARVMPRGKDAASATCSPGRGDAPGCTRPTDVSTGTVPHRRAGSDPTKSKERTPWVFRCPKAATYR
ncbi:hypothetical protein [Streptomyces sp. NBC_00347]|uniref:hypothetical protein n=1 Tax=Streptomyces sp. NBC_00347 TaxID=2975721 RepID=UPI00225C389B|nr:hypothetical protein [Streptomyces sp. NBC_00347]MCX5129413.1 hypothetical protein [Streptomyces sp. NBC_00347]